ncbi:MHYT domain-containing protein [Hydrogenophaga flava]|uniref:MHYT domain-containing protein n=1 Tax=Hydrogenophaga flava TaxID=65657 RepID=UPI000825BCFF|nr:MHYT domain-containing protein [Hydrogenophaga flava]
MLDRFFLLGDVAPTELLTGTYDYRLVALSVAIAILSSALAYHLAAFANASRERLSRVVGIGTSGVVMGTGVWMMHFIGMMSFQLCVQVSYDPAITALSLLPALAASWLALSRTSEQDSALRMVINGTLIGAGIGLMHYGGMAAMVMAPSLRYDPALFVVSLIVAIGLAIASLFVRGALRTRLQQRRWLSNAGGGAVLGLAISGMHYMAILATRFIGQEEPGSEVLQSSTSMVVVLIMSKVLVALVIFVVVINMLLRYRDLYFRSKALAEMEARLREQADASKLIAEEAKDKAELLANMRSEFLSSMSHEIRTPMHGIMGLIGEIQRQPISPKVRELAELLDVVTRNMLHLLNDILDYSKLEGGQFQLQPRRYQMTTEVQGVTASFDATARHKGLTLITEVPADLPVTLDPVRVNQIINNLVGNAIKFTERGFVKLSVDETHNPQGARCVRIQVEDSGVGIRPEVRDKIFDKYYQVVDSSINYVSGTGLGLSICKQLTTLMGGSISVASELGRGTTFTVEIPCDAVAADAVAPVEAAPQAVTAPVAETSALRVLAADDNSINRALLTAYFQDTGHTLVTVEDGRQAVDAAKKSDFDVVLMDIGMPVLNGPAAMDEIRRISDAWAQRPFIALTANARKEDKQDYLAKGFAGYVSKPFTREELMAEIGRVANAKTQHAALQEPAAAEELDEDSNELEVLMDNFAAFSPADLKNFIVSAAAQLHLNLSIIRDRLHANDVEGLEEPLHCIAGSAPAIGCVRLGQITRQAMDHIRTGGPKAQILQLAQSSLAMGEGSVQWLHRLARGM